MKGLILSGGTGTRLRPITFTSAKQLVPIANKPILFYAIETVGDAGITDIGIIVGDTKEEVKETVGDGSAFGVKITYIEQEAPLGLAHAVKIAEDFIAGDSFVMFLGDNLIKEGIAGLVEEFERDKPNCQILLAHVENPEQFGVAELTSDGKVERLIEKPKDPPSDLALVGVYMFDPHIFEAVKAIKPSWRDELEITDAIQYLLEKGYDVRPHVIDGWWKDTGKLDDILEANRIMLEGIETDIRGTVDADSTLHGRVVIEEGAHITNSVIRGPAIIGKNSEITGSYVGPFTAIHNNVRLVGSEVEHSIILADCVIENLGGRLEGSLLGRNVKLHKSDTKPRAFRLMVGDNSQVEVV
ncbi:MAG: glucose-1-phosphate thymidylyltransferase [Actinobacteria bacterium]|nr:glucose-1-phosphate thymidylyltransferase [Actinomycetota bacterium]